MVLADAQRKGIHHQYTQLTQSELEERRSGFTRFQTEPNVPGQRLRMTPALTALEVAAQCGRKDMVVLLRAAGADESAWLASSQSDLCDEGEYGMSIHDIGEKERSVLCHHYRQHRPSIKLSLPVSDPRFTIFSQLAVIPLTTAHGLLQRFPCHHRLLRSPVAI